jgi:adenylate cyclase
MLRRSAVAAPFKSSYPLVDRSKTPLKFRGVATTPMTELFISYARSTEKEVALIAECLRSLGYSVWRDDELPAHRAYGEVIEERLNGAKAVVVLWSADAAKSHWVRAEADTARTLGKLVQVSLDGTSPPLPFNQIHCGDLSGWSGDLDAPSWRKLRDSLAELAGEAKPVAPAATPAHGQKLSICVLPFENMSGDPDQAYFSDGISEDIITDLSKVSALAVVARQTAFNFRGCGMEVPALARKLGVSHILEGSVRKHGGRVRITAQLIDGNSGDQIWAERYDRDLTDIFALQDEISATIVAVLKVKLLPSERKAIQERGTDNVDAYNLYLMARQIWIAGNHGDIRREEKVVRICRRALEIDPDYARAWALMAIAQSGIRYGFGRAGDDGTDAARKALSIDPRLADAHCALIRRLIEEKRYEEAEAEVAEALRYNPDSWELNKEAVRLHCRQKHLEESAYYLKRCTEMDETDFYNRGMLITYYHALGRREELECTSLKALQLAELALEDDPENIAALSLGAKALAALGDERTTAWMDRALLLDPDNLNLRYNFATAFATHLGQKDSALALLRSSLGVATGTLISWAKVDPDVDCLRGNEEFQAILAEAESRAAKLQRGSASSH